MRNWFKIIIVIAVFVSCTGNIDNKKEEGKIKQVLENQQLSWNSGDINTYMEAYWKSDKLRFASGDRVTFGWEKTLKNYEKSYPDKESMGELFFTDLIIETIDADDALVFGRWQLYRINDIPNGLFTLHFKKIKGEWKIVSDHTSSARTK